MQRWLKHERQFCVSTHKRIFLLWNHLPHKTLLNRSNQTLYNNDIHHFFYTLHYSHYFVDNQSYTKCTQPLHSSTLPHSAYTHNRTKELKRAQVNSVTRDRTFYHSDTFFLFPWPIFLSGTTDLCRRQCNQKTECIYTLYIPDYQILTSICAECRQNIRSKVALLENWVVRHTKAFLATPVAFARNAIFQ